MREETAVVPLAHTVLGSGTPEAVLIHGLFDSSTSWRFVAPRLAEHYTVVTLDLRGHGASPRPATGYAPMDFGRDVQHLMAELNLYRPVVIGHSMGARVAYHMAAQADPPMRALVIGDMGMNPMPDAWIELQALMERLPDAFDTEEEADEFVRATFPPSEQAYFRRTIENLRWRFSKSAVVETVRKGRAEDWITLAPRIELPTLLIRGGDSDEISPSEAQRMLAHFPNCRMVEIPHVGHFIHEDAPEAFTAAVLRFMKDVV